MKPQDNKSFAEALGLLAQAIGCDLSSQRIKVLFQVMQDLSIEQIQSACSNLMNTWECPGQFPTPAQFRRILFGDPKQRANRALDIALRHADAYASIKFEDKALAYALESTFQDWNHFCTVANQMCDRDWTWKKKEFIEAYIAAANLNLEPKSDYFRGIFEASNMERNFTDHLPKQILFISATGDRKEIERPQIGEGFIDSTKKLLDAMPDDLKEIVQ